MAGRDTRPNSGLDAAHGIVDRARQHDPFPVPEVVHVGDQSKPSGKVIDNPTDAIPVQIVVDRHPHPGHNGKVVDGAPGSGELEIEHRDRNAVIEHDIRRLQVVVTHDRSTARISEIASPREPTRVEADCGVVESAQQASDGRKRLGGLTPRRIRHLWDVARDEHQVLPTVRVDTDRLRHPLETCLPYRVEQRMHSKDARASMAHHVSALQPHRASVGDATWQRLLVHELDPAISSQTVAPASAGGSSDAPPDLALLARRRRPGWLQRRTFASGRSTINALLHRRQAEVPAARLLGATAAARDAIGYRRRDTPHPEELDALAGQLAAEHPGAFADGRSLRIGDAIEYARRARGHRGRPSHGWLSLTPTEHRVTSLVAKGHTNEQVAERLLMSPTTVKTHLTHVFTKLGVANRTELAAAYANRD